MSKLTAIQVRNAKPKDKGYKLGDGHGMYLHVARSGKKTWRYRYKIAGKESTYVLGEYPLMNLKQARKAREKARELVKAGLNPAEERKKKRQKARTQPQVEKKPDRDSFEAIALEWISQQKDRWSREHAMAVRSSLAHDAFPALGHHRIDTITPPMVLQVIRTIENRGSLEIARKVLQRMNAVFRYAVQTGRATYNPAADMKGVLKTRKVTHMPALDARDLPEFLRKLTTSKLHVTTRLALKFTILTAARSGEVRGATWDEIDLDGAVWRIPAERMKMSVPHIVPLSKQAVAILERAGKLFGYTGYVFPGIRQDSKKLSSNTMLYAMHRLGYQGKATVHGFRAVFSTIANEAGFNPDAIERQLAHRERNQVRAAYHRSEYLEQRKEMMQWWADHLDYLEAGAEVIPINRTAAGT
ncbi:integrase [Desulfolithobacter dissulfuricans]|uniref:Integrase n=1 Tax=Desulfolithobacter dissulfuricans TaxID=2795293 RepID=A0A915XKW5_9BACT|nr:integrase arm-type DNA-binding domain-containing protein [Desulfolithobacter dissulfuricans]BCO08801.1 integrase [Desulfolithobacter dissulfuricans]